ncbi:MAG TPA: DinB family protein [Pyrinomonadaceae bacterium]
MRLVEDVLEDFTRTIEEASARLLSLTDAEAAARRGEGDWSAKETLGHLVDSAANNHQRFVRAQFKEDLVFDGYAQDDWVRAQRYADEPWPLVVNLWRFYNLHLAHVCRHAPEAERRRPRARHNLREIGFAQVTPGEPATLEHLMRDYVEHLKHHLRQILGEV